MKLSPALKTLVFLQAASSSLASCPSASTPKSNIAAGEETSLVRDVLVIGGGGSGTHIGIRLQQEGYSVALVEKKERLGGHVDTYRDAATGVAFDYGVTIYANISAVNDYFAYLDVPLVSVPSVAPNTIVYANFQTDGKGVEVPSSFAWTNQTALGLSLYGYLQQQGQYPFVDNGFDLPDPVPEDLLLPWGDFMEKYSLQALANVAFMYLQGMGNILAQPTLYVMKYLTQRTVNTLLGSGPAFVTSGSNGNQALYEAALSRLGADAFLNSSVVEIQRNESGVRVVFDSAAGRQTVYAKKLVVAIQPTLANLQALNLDLTETESSLFGQFNNSYYWDAILRVPGGLPAGTALQTIDPAAPYGIPALPGTYTFTPSPVAELYTAWYGSPSRVSDAEVAAALLGDLATSARANGYNLTAPPSLVALNNHEPFELAVPAEAIRAGFYGEVNALQGQGSTWWTGAAWQAHDSSDIWNWHEATLLPKILASLQ